MSPLWRDEIGVYLAPHKLVLTRLARGLRPRPVAEAAWSRPFHGDANWKAALDALDGYLAQEEWQDAAVRIVLADNWVRYAMVPYSASLSGADERLVHARHVLTGIYGEVVTQWSVTLSEGPPGVSHVACALPSMLVDEIQLRLDRHKLPLKSLQPQLVAAYNHWREALPDGSAWFVSLEQGTLAAARLIKGGWDRVHSVRIGADWAVELRRLQTFGRLANESTQDTVYVDAPAGLRAATAVTGAGLVWLDEERAGDSTAGKLEFLRRYRA